MKKILSLTLAILVLVCAVVVFVPTGTASASETDGIGTWVWNSTFLNDIVADYEFDFVSDGISYSTIHVEGGLIISLFYGGINGLEVYNALSGGWQNGGENSPYRIIDIKTAPPAEFLSILQANATYQGSSEPPAPITYNVTLSVTNGIAYGDSMLTADQTGNYIIIPNTGYGLPAIITVTGATLNSYDPNTGKFSLSNASADVSVSASCPALPVVTTYPVTFNISFGRVFGDSSIDNTQTKTYTLVPNNGFGLPNSIVVSGATLDSYNKSSGEFSISSTTAAVTITAVCPAMAVDPNSASYQAGYDKGVHDAFSIFEGTVLTTNEFIGEVSVVAYNASGDAVPGSHWDMDFNYLYNNEQYLQIYNITNGSAVDHYVITLRFSNGKSFVPVSVRSPVGFTSSGNSTAPLKPVSYFGNGLYGSNFTEFGSSTDFIVQMPGNQNSIALRLVGSGYGQKLDAAYDKGVQDGFAKGEKVGYDKGKADGIEGAGQYTFFNLISAIIDVPIKAIMSLFNLEIFGVNLAPLITALLTACVAITIIKLIL